MWRKLYNLCIHGLCKPRRVNIEAITEVWMSMDMMIYGIKNINGFPEFVRQI